MLRFNFKKLLKIILIPKIKRTLIILIIITIFKANRARYHIS